MTQKVFIPFRLREGADMRRGANLEIVLAWWWAHGYEPVLLSDGLNGDAPFNRHRAYNRAMAENPGLDVFVFSEADMLIHPKQIDRAVELATEKPGLVVPFTEYRYLSDETTAHLRDTYNDASEDEFEYITHMWGLPADHPQSVFSLPPESTMVDGDSIGAVNVVSAKTLLLTGGFTEATHGNWYDDNIIEEGFAFLTKSPTRWVTGPAVHMYHLPGWKGDHLTAADKAATAHNRNLLLNLRADIRMRKPDAVRKLMSVRVGEE